MMITAFGEILYDVFPDGERPGGAPFNFIYHIRHLTGEGTVISRIGADDRGIRVLELLKSRSIDHRFIQVDERHPTGTAVVQVRDGGIPEFTITEDVAYDFIEPDHTVREAVASGGMLYFGTLAQRAPDSRETLYHYAASAQRCFLDVNLRQRYYTREILRRSLELSDFVKVNDDELRSIHTMFLSGAFDRDLAVRRLMRTFSIAFLAVTSGGDGSHLYSAEHMHHHATPVDHIVDTVGAGDAFSAMMCLCLMNGMPIDAANIAASEFSAAICTVRGALPDDPSFYRPFTKMIA